MVERDLTVEEFVNAVETLARSLLISMQVLQEKANPILFKQALAVAVGTVVKDDELVDFIEEVREWSGSSVQLLREDEAYQAAIRDARFRHEFESEKAVKYLKKPSGGGAHRGRRRRQQPQH
jgi:nicotinamide mononucleotide adenylyltransferase